MKLPQIFIIKAGIAEKVLKVREKKVKFNFDSRLRTVLL